jgi:translocation and assembly module TamA
MRSHLLYTIALSCLFVACLPYDAHATRSKKTMDLNYQVRFPYNLPLDITEKLKEHSALLSSQGAALSSVAALHFRAEKDIPHFLAVLHSFGYYNATVKTQLRRMPNGIIHVDVLIQLGPVYHLSAFKIVDGRGPSSKARHENPELKNVELSSLGIKVGSAANAMAILEAEKRLVNHMRNNGYPEAKIVHRQATADYEARSVAIAVYLVPGPFAYFGETSIEGLHKVKPIYARYLLHYTQGDPFDAAAVRQTQSNYFDTSLFSYVSITHQEEGVRDGSCLPMKITVRESRQRSFSIGASYATVEGGFGGTLTWEHRNFRGVGQRLTFQANINPRFKDVSLSYREPNLRKKGRFRSWKIESRSEDYKSYDARSVAIYRRFDRNVNKHFKQSFGWTLENLRDNNQYTDKRHYLLLKAPIFLRWSTSGDGLNPVKGFEFEGGFTPTLDSTNVDLTYLKTRFTFAAYLPLSPSQNSVLAFRTYFANIIGADLERIPASKRIYSGTEQFLRGYDYLTVSPLNSRHQPTGGKSMLMYNLEMRFHTTEDLGFVLFYDLGSVYPQSFINRRYHMLQSTGIGGRYFSVIGPLRIDFAFPINPRKREGYEHSLLKLYVSIGQTF